MTDLLAGSALALTVLLVGGLAVERNRTDIVALRRADWACTRTRGSFEVRREPNGAGGSTPKLVAMTVCAGWERR